VRRWAATLLGVGISFGVMALIRLQMVVAEIDDREKLH